MEFEGNAYVHKELKKKTTGLCQNTEQVQNTSVRKRVNFPYNLNLSSDCLENLMLRFTYPCVWIFFLDGGLAGHVNCSFRLRVC